MTKAQLQNDIKARGGYILSDGTCNLLHLLPKAYDLLVTYNLRGTKELQNNIRKVFKPGWGRQSVAEALSYTSGSLYLAQYHSYIELKDDTEEDRDNSNWLWNETIFNYFNDLAPKGYYFGSSEGDGACIGWFVFESQD